MGKWKVNRRDFLKTTAAAGVSLHKLHAGGTIPRRVLGRTGALVSVLAFGGGSRFLMYQDEGTALSVLNEAIDSGINYLDTAISYGNGKSEERYGKVLRNRRQEVFVATKVEDRTYDGALKAVEASLKRLQTDHVDLLHVHGLDDLEDLAKVEQGVLKALYRMRDEKLTRFIGMTSHSQAATLKEAIQRHDLDCVQMALNPVTNTGHATGFERIALPAANARNLGVLAMKVMGQETLVGNGPGKTTGENLLKYAFSLPVAACVVGMPRIEMLRANIQTAQTYKTLSPAEKESIREGLSPSTARFDRFMLHHRDGDSRA